MKRDFVTTRATKNMSTKRFTHLAEEMISLNAAWFRLAQTTTPTVSLGLGMTG